MSLIADALQRAKEAQQQAAPPPPSSLQFRPIEPAQYAQKSLGLMLPAALAVVALLLLFFAWQWAQRTGLARPAEVKARTAIAANPTPAPQPASAPVAPLSGASSLAVEPIPTAQTTSSFPPKSAEVASLPSPAPVTAAVDAATATVPSEPTNSPVTAAPENGIAKIAATIETLLPKPAPPKLQAIIFSPNRPSVMIGGRTLFIGDKLNEFRVVAIDRESATLAGTGQTNVLTLSE
jgi:hypothetical protein